jgi:hypothetical protein
MLLHPERTSNGHTTMIGVEPVAATVKLVQVCARARVFPSALQHGQTHMTTHTHRMPLMTQRSPATVTMARSP